MERIFTFGCSWTKYNWPTWADIVRYSIDAPVYNWALGGMGNVGIYHRLIECDLKYKFTEKDIIIIQWTSWTREDRFIERWQSHGNIFNNSMYDENFIKKYWSWENDVIKNCTAIISANKTFNINFQTTMIPIGIPEFITTYTNIEDSDITNFYINNLPNNIVNFPNEKNTKFYGKCIDGHPDPLTHLYFYNNILRNNIKELPIYNQEELKNFQLEVSKKIDINMDIFDTLSIIRECSLIFDEKIFNSIGF